ncbi:MAG: Ig-like domain-containing protein [Bacteroidales bacterium]
MVKRADVILFLLIAGIVFTGLFTNCAKEVSPTGGPKDSIPPSSVREEPPNYSTNFDSREITIYFNEFIQLKDVRSQFLSSPPFKNSPDIKEKGKSIEIELKDELMDSTTYTLNFGNAVVDFREGNPLKNFRYVFSTGDELDSLELYGKVIDAYTKEPRENVLVMLYSTIKDSIPLLELPEYVSRTNEDGEYHISNIRLDTFKIFALEDENSNYLYDSPEEDIGFSDSLIIYEKEHVEIHDTIYQDSIIPSSERGDVVDSIIRIRNNEVVSDTIIHGVNDSVLIDTIFYEDYYGYDAQQKNLKMFNEENREQYLKTGSRDDKRRLSFIFNRPVIDSIRMGLVDSTDYKFDEVFLPETNNMESDTVSYWVKDADVYNKDVITCWVNYQRRDSLNQLYWEEDTVKFRYSFDKDEDKEVIDTMNINTNIPEGGEFDLDKDISIRHEYPLESIDTSRICLWKKEDTLLVEQQFRLYKKDGDLYNAYLDVDWEPGEKYKFQILPQSVHAIYEFYHDTVDVNFSTREEDYYGSLTLDVQGIDTTYLIQLFDKNDKVVKSKWVENPGKNTVNFEFIPPAVYNLRLILDENKNKEWDTGNYMEHRQPEDVLYYPEEIDVRSNWELDLEWNQE